MVAEVTFETHDIHGTGPEPVEVYRLPPGPPVVGYEGEPIPGTHQFWPAVTDVSCPVQGCGAIVRWYEAGQVPGYRRCDNGHRFFARGTAESPVLIRDRCCEGEGR